MTRTNRFLCVLCLLTFVGGLVLGYNYSVGYETVDLIKYLINKICTLLQSFAFVILVIAIMLRTASITLLNQVSKNVDVIMEKLVERGFKQQETYKSQDVGKLGEHKL